MSFYFLLTESLIFQPTYVVKSRFFEFSLKVGLNHDQEIANIEYFRKWPKPDFSFSCPNEEGKCSREEEKRLIEVLL